VTLGFTLISIKLLTNYLGVDGVGEYNTITTYVNFFIVIADLGLFSVTVREIAKNPDSEKKILANVLVIRIISALAACLIAILIILLSKYRGDNNIVFGTIIACGFLFFNLLGSVYDIILQYRLKMQFSALAEFLSKIISIIALIIVIRFHGNFLLIMSTIALSGLMIFLFKWLFSTRFTKFGISYNKKIADWIFNMAWPIGVVFIISNLFFKLDTLMLFVIKGAAAVGIYSVAYKILEVSIFFGSYFASSLKPIISSHIEKDKNYLKGLVSKSISVMLFLGLPISIISFVFSREIIIFLSNESFISGSRALVFLAFTLPIIYIDILLAEILIAADERKLLLRISVFILLFNFVCNLILIPKYSFMGGAYGTFLSQIVLLVIDYHYTKKIIKYRLDYMMILRICLISFLSVVLAIVLKTFLPLHFLILSFVVISFYLFLAYCFKIITKDSIQSIAQKEKTNAKS